MAADGPVDLAIGSFTDHPPWLVDLDRMQWRRGIDGLREANRSEAPALTRRRVTPPIGRFVLAGVHLGGALAVWAVRERGKDVSGPALSRRLRQTFERLGPTYIKLGQILSSGQGVFPDYLVEEFKLCRDRVPPEPFDAVRRVIEEDFGQPIDAIFAEIDRRPIAAASIAQVHAARLRTGEEVVVKVQRPRVRSLFHRDVRAMAWVAPLLVGRIPVAALANPPALVELFAEQIVEELDFRLEADNMLDIARVLAETDQRIMVVPRPHPQLVTRRVLVMERLDGYAFDDVRGVREAGIDTHAMLRAAMIAFLEGAMLRGVFHGDLHGGNLFIRPDGRIALMDYGITGRLEEPNRRAFVRLIMSGALNDVRSQLAALRDLGALPPETDIDGLIRDLDLDQPMTDPTTMSADELVHELQRVIKSLLGYGARMPKALMLYVKNMLFLDGAIALHAPDIDLFAEILHIATYFGETHGERLAEDAGMDIRGRQVDISEMKRNLGFDPDVQLSHRDVQARRALIRERLQQRRGRRNRSR